MIEEEKTEIINYFLERRRDLSQEEIVNEINYLSDIELTQLLIDIHYLKSKEK